MGKHTLVATVDDDPDMRAFIRAVLQAHGLTVEEHATGASILARNPADLSAVCLDLGLEDTSGLEVLAGLRMADPELPVIVVTGERVVETAVQAMREGAYDYVLKPLDETRIVHAVGRGCERRDLARRVRALERDPHHPSPFVGESPAIREVLRQIDQVQSSDIPVCILGESGSGKELVARAIHEGPVSRKGPFVAINCAAIPESLQESELFGHEKGAFTGALATYRGRFEQASGGTLLLDEVGEMHPSTQAKLLRVLQERVFRRVGGTRDLEVRARIVCATNRDLEAEVRAGRFRADLYFRLVVYPIRLPPLRARREDIPRLVGHFLHRLSADTGRAAGRISPEALGRLVTYEWPGNVRELENVIHRALLSRRGEEITVTDLPNELGAPDGHGRASLSVGVTTGAVNVPFMPLAELERIAIVQALERGRGQVSAAARLLGMSRATLYRRLAKLELPVSTKKAHS